MIASILLVNVLFASTSLQWTSTERAYCSDNWETGAMDYIYRRSSTRTTLDECKAACIASSTCHGITYYNDRNHGWDYHPSGLDCVLCTGADSSGVSNVWDHYLLKNTPECVNVNHINDNPGFYTCDCVDPIDECISDGECVAEAACPSSDGQAIVGKWSEPVSKNAAICYLNDCGTAWPNAQDCFGNPGFSSLEWWNYDPSLTVVHCKTHCWNTPACVGFSYSAADSGPRCTFFSQYPETCGTPAWPNPSWRGNGAWEHYIAIDKPTPSPTRDPTKFPSHSPSVDPTVDPTNSPTARPTQFPTKAPTESPTLAPTFNPTRNPSNNPTSMPTRNPSSTPTHNPTRSPSNNPTRMPTCHPTLMPTSNPSKPPTAGDYIIKVKGFHGNPAQILDAEKIHSQPKVDVELFDFERKIAPATRRLLRQLQNSESSFDLEGDSESSFDLEGYHY